MTTAQTRDALREALARCLAQEDGWQDPAALWTDNVAVIARGGEGDPVWWLYRDEANALLNGPLAPILSDLTEARAKVSALEAEVEAGRAELLKFGEMYEAEDKRVDAEIRQLEASLTEARALARRSGEEVDGLKAELADAEAKLSEVSEQASLWLEAHDRQAALAQRAGEERDRAVADAARLTDLATGACFHFFACGPGIHADDDCGELVPSMADLAKAIGFSNDPATDEEIAGVRLSAAEHKRVAARSVIEPTEGGAADDAR